MSSCCTVHGKATTEGQNQIRSVACWSVSLTEHLNLEVDEAWPELECPGNDT